MPVSPWADAGVDQGYPRCGQVRYSGEHLESVSVPGLESVSVGVVRSGKPWYQETQKAASVLRSRYLLVCRGYWQYFHLLVL